MEKNEDNQRNDLILIKIFFYQNSDDLEIKETAMISVSLRDFDQIMNESQNDYQRENSD